MILRSFFSQLEVAEKHHRYQGAQRSIPSKGSFTLTWSAEIICLNLQLSLWELFLTQLQFLMLYKHTHLINHSMCNFVYSSTCI